MKYTDFYQQFKSFPIFSIKDIELVDSKFEGLSLIRWQDKGYIKKIKKGYYIFSDLPISEKSIFSIANKIYKPSYISFESAFSYYGIIPEAVFSVTSATSKKTVSFETPVGKFTYASLKPELIFGYTVHRWHNSINTLQDNLDYPYLIADLEKALLDYFYINNHIDDDNQFEGLRFNLKYEDLDIEKLNRYLSVFANKSLEKRINKFLEYIKNAIN